MPTKPLTTLAFLLLFTAGAHAGELVVTHAEAEPGNVLPGMPVWISLTVKNTGDRPAQLPRSYIVEVTTEAGETFLVDRATTRVAQLPLEYEGQVEVSPGASRRIDFATGDDLGSGMFFDRRLWQPGTNTIRLVFSNDLSDEQLDRSNWVSALKTPPLVTPPISLKVETPSGADADAWQAMLQANHNRGLLLNAPKGAVIARELYDRFPGSRYAPYFLRVIARDVLRNGGETRFATVAAMNETIEKIDAIGIMAADIRLGRALIKAREALSQSDVDSAIRATALALEDLKAIERNATYEHSRLKAQQAMRKVKTPDAIREHFRAAGKLP